MASSLATALYYKGADVFFIHSSTSATPDISSMHKLQLDDTSSMLAFIDDAIRVAKKGVLSEATLMDTSTVELIQKQPYFFGVAAISDYIPRFPQNGKIKKADIGETWDLKLKKNIDVLSSINKEGIYTIGFKAEMDKQSALQNATNMLKSKNIDAVCLNILNNSSSFGSENNQIDLITKDEIIKLPINDKLSLSLELLDNLKEKFND
jgi:phosphopantothenoylcysteine decarboxylase/phosphopantothenate--cysteine ligase